MHPKNHIKFVSPLFPKERKREFGFVFFYQGNIGTISSQVIIRVTTFLLVGFSLLENLNVFFTAPQNPHSENGTSQSSYKTLQYYIVVYLKNSPKKAILTTISLVHLTE